MTPTTWIPTAADLAWCRNLLDAVAEGGIWGTTNAIYRVEHAAKRLVLLARAPGFDPELHERNRVAFWQLGYTVVDEPDGPGPVNVNQAGAVGWA